MLDEMVPILQEMEKTDEFFKVLARVLKKAHVALVEVGFTKKQATQILAGQGLGMKP